jgi:protein-disulfide isomerase
MSVSPPEEPRDPSQALPLARVYLVSGLISVVVAALMCVAGFFTYDAIRGDSGGEGPTAQVNPSPTPSTPQAEPTATGPTGPIEVSIDDDPISGAEDAAVTIVEFSDFQ